ncbi:Eco57I restriction-modification methylase domain-containing protein [Paenibacillus camerounensis]|uniref:Eco57I restriction-modification methylase domain-containing protein n=1 Tax=Paenibacillus camerounensis TaxID=1243663 RepID=UPI0005A74E15|nr:hypothetical protein [Paenibacillus camerounensis]
MKKKQISAAIDMLTWMKKAEMENRNESVRKEIFVGKIGEIFQDNPIAKMKVNNIYMGAEGQIRTEKSSRSNSVIGFQDTDLGNVTIEWKRDTTITGAFDVAHLEIRRYISGKWNIFGYDDKHIGIITDGLRWKAYQATCTEIKDRYNADEVTLLIIEEVDASNDLENSAAYLVDFLEKYLITDNVLQITPGVLNINFGEGSVQFNQNVSKIQQIVVKAYDSDSIVQNAINLWTFFQQYNYQSPPERVMKSYSQHLYLVILCRVIVARSLRLDSGKVIDDSLIKEIITGDIVKNSLRVSNYVESDYYSWMLSLLYIDEFVAIAKEIYFYIKEYDFNHVDKINLFHLIFEEIIPADARKENGQTSTPDSLSTNIFKRIRPLLRSDSKILEPAVGTGVIFGEAIRQLQILLETQNVPKVQQIKTIQQNIVGFDVDPIAVILSKGIWLMTNNELLSEAMDVITIPIYHTDSLIEKAIDQEIIEVKLDDEFGFITIPQLIAKSHSALAKLYKKCDQLALSALTNNNLDTILRRIDIHNILDEDIKGIDEFLLRTLQEATNILIRYFFKKRSQVNDGIWQFMLLNTSVPKGLRNEFDFIVSNPPWLAMSSLPNVKYGGKLELMAKRYKIKPTGETAHHTEIATIFMLICIDNYLKMDGTAAFILPGTIMNGDQHYGFRKAAFSEIVPIQFDELWEIPNGLSKFKVKSCVLFCTKILSDNKGFSYRELQSLDEHENVQLAQLYLVELNKKNAYSTNSTIASAITSPYLDKFRQGADLMPRTAVFVETLNKNAGINVTISTSKYAVNNKNNKKLKGRVFKGIINQRFLHRTVISEMLLPFFILSDDLTVALPVEISEEIELLNTEDLLLAGENYSAEWFAQFDDLPEFRNNSFRKGIDVRGKLSQQMFYKNEVLVHMGAGGSQPCAAIQLNDKTNPAKFIADQTTYVAPFDNLDEARYVVAFINSDYINAAIKDFQAEGGFTERHVHKLPLMFIPKYKQTELQLAIVKQVEEIEQKILMNITADELNIENKLTSRRSKVRKMIIPELVTLNHLISEFFHVEGSSKPLYN